MYKAFTLEFKPEHHYTCFCMFCVYIGIEKEGTVAGELERASIAEIFSGHKRFFFSEISVCLYLGSNHTQQFSRRCPPCHWAL